MDVETEKSLGQLVAKLQPTSIYISTEGNIVGYVWNRKKKALMFLSPKEVVKLTKKGIAWKHLGEDWFETKSRTETTT